jgi:mono/diheme cytochrome c family protein
MRNSHALIVLIVAIGLAACERDMRDMYDQSRPHPDGSATRFDDGRDARLEPKDAVARAFGVMAADSSGRSRAQNSAISNRQMLERGRNRYDIYCAPCHSPVGDGDGMVVRRGFPRPESFHIEKFRTMSDAEFDSAITDGAGVMKPMGGRIDESDRQAIIAYIRALQLSQQATLDDVPAEQRAVLDRSAN